MIVMTNETNVNYFDDIIIQGKPKRTLGLIKFPIFPTSFNVKLDNTIITANQAMQKPIFTYEIGNKGGLLYSLAFFWSSITQSNYKFLLFIGTPGLNLVMSANGSTPQFQNFPSTAGYNPIPEGTAIYLAPGSKIQLYAYNATATTDNGNLDIALLLDNIALG